MSDTPTANGGSLRERVAEEVRVELARKRMSGTQLARRLRVSQAYIWRRLSGETALDLDDLERIGTILEVTPADLVMAAMARVRVPTEEYVAPTNRVMNSRPPGRPAARAGRAVTAPPKGRPPSRPSRLIGALLAVPKDHRAA
jgi:transcriptional regulator with XRE-family HTH domain